MSAITSPSPFILQEGPIFALPQELRDEIYQFLFHCERQAHIKYKVLDDSGRGAPQAAVPLPVAFLRTCHQALNEAHDVLYRNNSLDLKLTSSETLQFFSTISPYSLARIKHVTLQLEAASFAVCKVISDRMLLQTLTSPDWGNPYFLKNLHFCFLSGSILELRLVAGSKERKHHETVERQAIGNIIASTVEDVVKANILKTKGLETAFPSSPLWESAAWDRLLPYTVRQEWDHDSGRIVVFRPHPWVADTDFLTAKEEALEKDAVKRSQEKVLKAYKSAP